MSSGRSGGGPSFCSLLVSSDQEAGEAKTWSFDVEASVSWEMAQDEMSVSVLKFTV